MSILYNPSTNEPYIRLAAPHGNIILTPFRQPSPSDEAALVKNMNDPLVATWLLGPPFPYTLEDARSWTAMHYKYELQAARLGTQEPMDECPFQCIREIMEEGQDGAIEEDALIGAIDIARYQFLDLPEGSRERADAVERNSMRRAGDREIVWTVGDWLAPSHHGRGIMTAAMKTLIYGWVVPRMNARYIRSTAFVGNHGSVRVFEKLGFRVTHVLKDWVELPASRGGGRRSLNCLALDLVD
ncbi:acetyltransferase, GNAT family [Aspergillus campestris IBT 28561]|uniref:Acetyltransferase, GNAT family n=1 Tax=Aspergillus campestris (strain IBT 28561) TaxID=1392248 RepID=A0A2I1D2Q7_ASPC2|nr:acetyltransferase, GNAT family [Aspergillus campestris IBT 28561]PKY04153.1 acetyltransferase, GNAT family [Aspergillus campestris IBT 28561]